jgi:hypothetical protein
MNKIKDYNFDETLHLLCSFMRASERSIIKKFASLPNAQKLSFPPQQQLLPAVYVPGTRKDKVLLVAHYDTVWGDASIRLERWGTSIVSGSPKVGIGADDRAGIAALWELRDTGHSLLILPDEEVGCMGSKAMIAFHDHLLRDERFAIQFDRRGSRDIVTYNCNNPKFNRFMTQNMPGFSKATGSVSDISVLCPALGIAGANLSIGFDEEHTEGEFLDVYDWIRTVTLVRLLLAKHCPRYVYKARKQNYKYSKYGVKQDTFDNFEAWHDYQISMERAGYGSNWDGPSNPYWDADDDHDHDHDQPDAYYWCRDCAMMYDEDEVSDTEVCNGCGGPLTLEAYETATGRTHG